MWSSVSQAVREAAGKHGIEAAALLGVVDIESAGAPFEPADGKTPQFLFERHIFHQQLEARAPGKVADAASQGLANSSWQPTTQYKDQGKSVERLALLARARAVDEDCALRSCSWGLGQTMGFHAETLGYTDAAAMVAALTGNIAAQVEAMIGEIKASNLTGYLAAHNWAAFARGYNGKGYRVNHYDDRLATAYAKWACGEDNTPQASEDVKQIQADLVRLGATIAADGFAGPETDRAIAAFQASQGLAADGIAGPLTRAAIAQTLAALPSSVSLPPSPKEPPVPNPVPTVTSAVVKTTAAPAIVGSNIVAQLTKLLASGIITTALGFATVFIPETTKVMICMLLVTAGTGVYTIGNFLHTVGLLKSTDDATYHLVEILLNQVSVSLGGKPVVQDLPPDPTPAAAA